MTEKLGESKKRELFIAVMGLIGILVTGLVSNWNRVFPDKDILEANIVGYRGTGDYETELTRYLEVSGRWTIVEQQQKELLKSYETALAALFPEESGDLGAIMKAASGEASTIAETARKYMSAYQRHFSVERIEELNKLYSTDIMRNMVSKLPALSEELAPLQAELLQDFRKRLGDRVKEILVNS